MTEEEFALWLGELIRGSVPVWMGVHQHAEWDASEETGGARSFKARIPGPDGIATFRVTVEDVTDI